MLAMPTWKSTGLAPGGVASGFTLVELMVTLAVAAILMALAVPSFTSVINGNRLTSTANELVSSLQLARSEALRRNTQVRVCRSLNGTSCAGTGQWDRWITLIVSNNEVLRDETVKPPVRVTSGAAQITIHADGLARSGSGLLANDLVVCIPTTRPHENRRVVNMLAGSRIAVSRVNGAGMCP